MIATFIRLVDTQEKAQGLREAAAGRRSDRRFDLDLSAISELPRSAFAYWMTSSVRALFRGKDKFDNGHRFAKQGLATSDDDRFIRLWYETPVVSRTWRPIAKGSRFLALL